MHLNKTGHQYYGYYYYNSKEEPVYFQGDDTTEKGKTRLSVFLPGQDNEENFLFAISGNSATGKWQNKTNSLSFSVVESNELLKFDQVYTTGSVKLRPDRAESPTADYTAASIWPKGNSGQISFLKKMINEAFGIKNSTEDIGQFFLADKKEFFKNYLSDNKEAEDSDLLNRPYSFSSEADNKLMIVFQSTKILTLALLNYSYSGGAHGNYGTSYHSLDLTSNKQLTLENVITADGKKQLSRLLEKYFRKTYLLKNTDPLTEGGLFENKIEPNENFFVTSKGIGFNYVPYEIGPYAMGEISVFIPFSELNNYLQPSFKKLID